MVSQLVGRLPKSEQFSRLVSSHVVHLMASIIFCASLAATVALSGCSSSAVWALAVASVTWVCCWSNWACCRPTAVCKSCCRPLICGDTSLFDSRVLSCSISLCCLLLCSGCRNHRLTEVQNSTQHFRTSFLRLTNSTSGTTALSSTTLRYHDDDLWSCKLCCVAATQHDGM